MIGRRNFVATVAGGAATVALGTWSRPSAAAPPVRGVQIPALKGDEDLFTFLDRQLGGFNSVAYTRILGAANAFKEGDGIVGVAADSQADRLRARRLLSNTRLSRIDAHPIHRDQLDRLLVKGQDRQAERQTAAWTLGQLKRFLLDKDETQIKPIMVGLSSTVIGCVVKLMSNAELIAVGSKIYNPLPGSRIGAKGYLGARIQPNSPTDHLDDIRWQVFDGWSYAVGDVVLGNNPVSSDPRSVAAIERTLQELLLTFEIDGELPHCVLSHIDIQAQVEESDPGSTALWFQSIAGCDSANRTFDISVQKMVDYANRRSGPYGLYFETGQGADFTNGHGHGFDMVLHESRKYGFARSLSATVAQAQRRAGLTTNAGGQRRPWVHLNDVAGFIGPEVFRTRDQLVRCCLEDIVMGKLHGLCIGLDVCSTLHMDVSLDDLDWCLEQVVPAGPAYLMALPTKIDPMLGYLTTGFQDHVRLRDRFGLKVNDSMWRFFQSLEVIDAAGRPTAHFGDPLWVYLKYCRKKQDPRSDEEIYRDGRRKMSEVRSRGVLLAQGHGARSSDYPVELDRTVRRIYADAKKSIWAELQPAFVATIPQVFKLSTRSADRTDYILHPETGERLSDDSDRTLRKLREQDQGRMDAQFVISDGLNALAIMDPGQVLPYLKRARQSLANAGFQVSPRNLIVRSGRVRAGYRIGETLFGGLDKPRTVLHVIGERPGTGHHTFSVYITAAEGAIWGEPGRVDHNITKVVSGVATTALSPAAGADETVRILKTLV